MYSICPSSSLIIRPLSIYLLQAAAAYDGTDDLLHSRSLSQNGLAHSHDSRSDSIVLTKEILKENNSKKNQKCCK